MQLHGKTCVVTGAGRGIGRALAMDLAAHGARLAICARSETQLREVGEALRQQHSTDVYEHALDVSDPGAVHAFAQAVGGRFGPADFVVNNAGMLGPVGRIDKIDLAAWHRTLAVNVGGIANVCAAFAPQMLEHGQGSIVNLSGGGTGGPNLPERISAYSASKAAVVALTEVLARELAPVRVNAVAPGAIATTFMDEVFNQGREGAGTELFETTDRQRAKPDSLDDFLALVGWLASDDSAWLSGRLLSARWDRIALLRDQHLQIERTSRFQLRRIDEVLYKESER